MLLRLMLAGLLCTAATLAAADIYRWKDEQGGVHFSDQPRQGAEKVQLKSTTIVPSNRPSTTLSPEAVPGAVALPYSEIAVASPRHEETIRNTRQVSVSISTQPALQVDFGHRIQLFLDGVPVAEPSAQTSYSLDSVVRGAHVLVAAVIGDDDRELARSEPSTFYLHQQSVRKKPTAPTKPPAKPPANPPAKPPANPAPKP